MPERKAILVGYAKLSNVGESYGIDDLDSVVDSINDGWILDPLFNSKPIRLENAVIYHLIKYGEGEEPQTPETPKVESIKSVGYEEVDALIKEGYQPRDYYAKQVTLIKMKEEKP